MAIELAEFTSTIRKKILLSAAPIWKKMLAFINVVGLLVMNFDGLFR
jgi:hypothetical protein